VSSPHGAVQPHASVGQPLQQQGPSAFGIARPISRSSESEELWRRGNRVPREERDILKSLRAAPTDQHDAAPETRLAVLDVCATH
jgi:hypothetical protein